MLRLNLEPEPQSSYASNRVLMIPKPDGAAVFLPLYRFAVLVRAAATLWDGK